MKRIFAIAFIACFGAATAFADISFGGSLAGSWKVLEDGAGDDLITSFGPIANSVRGRFNIDAVNEAGTFGGWMQFRIQQGPALLTSVWWKPFSSLKATYGYMWGGGNPIGVALADDDFIPIKFYGRSANYIPWGYEVLTGAHIEFTLQNLYIIASVPLDNSGNLSFNGWGTPYKVGTAEKAEDIFKHTMGRIAYTIPNVGALRLTVAGGTGDVTSSVINYYTVDVVPDVSLGSVDATVFDVGFALNALGALKLDLGVEIPLAGKTWLTANSGVDVEAQIPIAVNLRADVSSGAFKFAGGVSGKFGGKSEVTDNNNKVSTLFEQGAVIGVTLNPAVDLGILTAGVVGEVEYNMEDSYTIGDKGYAYDARLNWNVAPYIQKEVLTGGTVYIGFQISSNLKKIEFDHENLDKWDSGFKSGVDWSIPIGFSYSF
ncbi:MAG: hypothetical protein LBC53_09280 [Spirochaetaceae bacterium]|jgi:hypothetical protein|nr:hypothetical protein [Spirochaetaceae bacterium]